MEVPVTHDARQSAIPTYEITRTINGMTTCCRTKTVVPRLDY
jgi:hypothetical protein